MQLQIECNSTPLQKQLCLICQQSFKATEAKVIICNDQGNGYGEACPNCLKKGVGWLSDRFEKLSQSKTRDLIQHTQNWKIPAGV